MILSLVNCFKHNGSYSAANIILELKNKYKKVTNAFNKLIYKL